MTVARIDPEKCDRSPACPAARMCPQNAIRPMLPSSNRKFSTFFTPYEVDEEACTGCGKCVNICPTKSIELVEKSLEKSNLDKEEGVSYTIPRQV